MEKILDEHKYSYSELFKNIGIGNYLHVSLSKYSKKAVWTECIRQNKYANSKKLDNKFTTSSKMKKGYITIYQRK